MYKTHEIIILPYTGRHLGDTPELYIDSLDGKTLIHHRLPISGTNIPRFIFKDCQYFHLYLLSSETPKLNDWTIQFNDIGTEPREIFQVKGTIPGECIVKKIIATTDIILINQDDEYSKTKNLPQFPQSLIELYVKKYNEGNPLKSIDIEYSYEEGIGSETIDNNTGLKLGYKLKLNQNNEFIYKPLKESWSREEVIDLLIELHDDMADTLLSGFTTFDKWVENNL